MESSKNMYIKVPCIKVTQPIGTFYVATIGYKNLLKISYTDVRRLESNSTELERYIGIQRLLSPNRVKELRNYVTLIDATFPTSIIIQINEKETENKNGEDEKNEVLNVIYNEKEKILNIRNDKNVAKILDGQHRLEGLKYLKNKSNENFELNVTIFVNMDIEDQAIVFATINKSQTKVNKSLVADLFEYTKTRSPQKTAHNIARALDRKEESPFFGKIKILGTAENEKETITQATFVDNLLRYISGSNLQAMNDRDTYKRGDIPEKVEGQDEQKLFLRNMFIEERDTDIAQIIWNYFSAVEQKWPNAWSNVEPEKILNRSTGFIALMRFFKDIYLSFNKIGQVLTKDQFFQIFEIIDIDPDDFNKSNYLPGSTGQKKLYTDFLEKSGIRKK